MSTIVYKTGDLMEATETAIAHGCNTHGVMGAGVARLVKQRWPEAFYAYSNACDTGRFRVGSAQAVSVDDKYIYNLGTQRHPGPDATVWGVFLSFANLAEDALVRGINTVAIPKIAAGIGGLDWNTEVVPAITAARDQSSHPDLTLVVYELEA